MDEVNISTGEIVRKKTLADLPVLIIEEEYEEVLDLLKNKAVEIKFDPTVSRQKRKVKLKACSQILYDAAR